MRKMSKNRADDDTVSSTNGSVKADAEVTNGGPASDAEEEPEDHTQNADDEGADEALTDSFEKPKSEKEDTPPPRDPPKKRASKTRAKEAKKAKADSEDEQEEEYEVEEVIDSKKIRGKLHYLIRWKGYSAANNTWEAEDSVSCPELIKKFKESEKKSPKKGLKRKASESSPSKGAKRGRPGKKQKNANRSTPKPKKDFDYESADAEAEYEVERILEVHNKKNGKREFLIHWKGWSNRYDSWEPEEHLNCSDLIKKFMSKVKTAKETEQRELRVAPKTTGRFTLAQKSTGRRLSKRSNQRQRVRYDGAE